MILSLTMRSIIFTATKSGSGSGIVIVGSGDSGVAVVAVSEDGADTSETVSLGACTATEGWTVSTCGSASSVISAGTGVLTDSSTSSDAGISPDFSIIVSDCEGVSEVVVSSTEGPSPPP